MKYNKQPLDIPTQIAMLKGRGLNIVDEQAAEKTLSRISYFLQAGVDGDGRRACHVGIRRERPREGKAVYQQPACRMAADRRAGQ